MATTEDSKQTAGPKRDRSPAYPFISLKTSFERVASFDAKFGRHGSPMNKAAIAWGYKEGSSQSSQTLSALKYFGLIEYIGATNDRKVQLTDDARNYLRAQQASVKAEIAKACALRPKAMQTYWVQWNADRPLDEICLDQLIIKDGFTELAAKTFLRVYDETIAFAELDGSSKIEESSSSVEQERDEDRTLSSNPIAQHIATPAPMHNASHGAGHAASLKGAGMRHEVFALSEGDVTIQWPERISQESLEDFIDWLAILKRKVTRSVLPSEAHKKQEDDLTQDD